MCFTLDTYEQHTRKQLQVGKLSFASQFQRIQSMAIWALVLGQNIMSVGIWLEGSSLYAVLETESKEKGRLGARYNLQSYVPRNLLPPRRPHLLMFPELPIGWGLLAQHRRLWLTLCLQSTEQERCVLSFEFEVLSMPSKHLSILNFIPLAQSLTFYDFIFVFISVCATEYLRRHPGSICWW